MLTSVDHNSQPTRQPLGQKYASGKSSRWININISPQVLKELKPDGQEANLNESFYYLRSCCSSPLPRKRKSKGVAWNKALFDRAPPNFIATCLELLILYFVPWNYQTVYFSPRHHDVSHLHGFVHAVPSSWGPTPSTLPCSLLFICKPHTGHRLLHSFPEIQDMLSRPPQQPHCTRKCLFLYTNCLLFELYLCVCLLH